MLYLLLLRAILTATRTVVLFLLFLFVKAGEIAIGEDVVLYAGVGLDYALIQA